MPTAIARANSTDSITDQAQQQVGDGIQHDQGERHPQQQVGKAA